MRHGESNPSHSALVFGRRPIHEALNAGKRSLHKLWIAKGIAGPGIQDVIDKARDRGIPIEFVERQRLDQMTRHGHHQGVAAQLNAVPYFELDDLLKTIPPTAPAVLVALDEIQDPQNVGAILRSAGFFGAAGILIPKWRNAPVGDAAWRVSAGAAEHLSIVRVVNLVQAIDQLKEEGFEVLGADAAGEPLSKHAISKRTVLVVGNEGSGLRRLVREHCDKLVGIPARSKVGSLNVAAATAIFLYALANL